MSKHNQGKILIVSTSHENLGETGNKTGFWMEELAAPYMAFTDAGYGVDIASPSGGRPPVDAGSLTPDARTASVDRFEADAEAVSALGNTARLDSVRELDTYAAIYLVGGHGTMWDFPDDADLGRLLTQAASNNTPIGAVCHGVAGLLSAANTGGRNIIKDKKVTGFSNKEEDIVGLTQVVPFQLEDHLKAAGASYSEADPFSPYVVADGGLVTGQNSASSQGVAEKLLEAMEN